MRRIISAITVLLVFFSLQYGKVAGYLYCEVQAKVVLQQAADCGCDQYLIGMIGEDGSDGFTSSPVQEKPSDLFTNTCIGLSTPAHPELSKTHFNKQSTLLNRFPEPAFHPPA